MLLCTCNVGGVSKTFKNPKPALLNVLREYGPVPGDENGVKSKRGGAQDEGSKKKKRIDKNVRLLYPKVPVVSFYRDLFRPSR